MKDVTFTSPCIKHTSFNRATWISRTVVLPGSSPSIVAGHRKDISWGAGGSSDGRMVYLKGSLY